jgi:nitrogen regulatory protein P-II 1
MTTPSMSLLVAYVQPFQLESLADTLRAVQGFPGMTVVEARGFGGSRAHVPRPGEPGEVDPFRPTVRIEIVCATHDAPGIADALCRAAHTGHDGDGLLYTAPLTSTARIRNTQFGLRDDGPQTERADAE